MDKRKVKTKQKIQEALLRLLENYSFEKISISALCKEAKINRGTFYLHYKEVHDVFNEIENSIYLDIMTCLKIENSEDIFLLAMSKVKEYRRFVSLILSRNLDHDFVENILKVAKDYCINQWKKKQKNVSNEELNYTYSFLSHGMIGLVINWCSNDFKDSPQDIAKMCKNFSSYFSISF